MKGRCARISTERAPRYVCGVLLGRMTTGLFRKRQRPLAFQFLET